MSDTEQLIQEVAVEPEAPQPPPAPRKRSVYRVSYVLRGQPAISFVCAFSDQEASAFVGIRDGSASVSQLASPVDVAGVDEPRPEVAPPPINRAEFELPRQQFTPEEISKLRALLGEK